MLTSIFLTNQIIALATMKLRIPHSHLEKRTLLYDYSSQNNIKFIGNYKKIIRTIDKEQNKIEKLKTIFFFIISTSIG